jgi:hypothetical protein
MKEGGRNRRAFSFEFANTVHPRVSGTHFFLKPMFISRVQPWLLPFFDAAHFFIRIVSISR